ncbi:ATP-binding protein [Thermoleptolyngbya sichuanensis]|nr:ATP-binding protein [Thermoleptolyngbya sichuanensis]
MIFPASSRFKFGLSTGSVIVTALAFAVISSSAIYGLDRMAERSNNARLLLTQIKEQVSRLNALEWEGFSKQKIDEDLAEEIAENRENTDEILEGLEQLKQGKYQADLERILALHTVYQQKMAAVFSLIEAGQVEQASEAEADEIDEIYDDLYAEIMALEKVYIEQHQRTRFLVNLGTTLSLVFSASAISLVFHEFSKKLWQKNLALESAFTELKNTQEHLVQQEKMAALGQLIAGVAHEINNPLGAIQAAASNTNHALKEAIAGLPKLHHRLTPEQQESFFELISKALTPPLSHQEQRSIKRELTAQLKSQGVDDPRYLADLLIDIGVRKDLEFLSPILKSEHQDWAICLAHNLASSFLNNQTILRAVERSSKIVFALKSYARFDQTGEQKQLQITDGIENVLEIYHNQIKRNIQLVRSYQQVPDIWGYPDELIQVWTNLIHNAIQAMESGGTLTISVIEKNGGLEVRIADTGSGIPQEVQTQMFDAFFTTKAAGEGSGLGLYISKKIIDKHRGSIEVESHPGNTEFRVWLPANKVSSKNTDPIENTTEELAHV